MGAAWWVLWLGCATEVDIPPQRVALDAWREAHAAAEAGSPAIAVSRVNEALTVQPKDVNLLAWRAQWLAQSGDVEAAKSQLDALLADHPLYDEARYRRALLHAKHGDPALCASDLKVLLENKAVTRKELREEEAWAEHMQRAEFSFLAAQPPAMSVRYRERAMYAGTDFRWTVNVRGEDLRELALTAMVNGPVRLVSTEERWMLVQGESALDIDFRFRSMGPGSLTQGPVTIRTPAGSVTSDARTVTIEGVVVDPPNTSLERTLSLPSARIFEMEANSPWVEDTHGLWLLLGEAEQVVWTPELEFAPIVHTLLREGQPSARLLNYEPGANAGRAATASFGVPGGTQTRRTWLGD